MNFTILQIKSIGKGFLCGNCIMPFEVSNQLAIKQAFCLYIYIIYVIIIHINPDFVTFWRYLERV